MNIDQAKKILGSSALNLSDEEIMLIIQSLNKLIDVGLQQFEKKRNPKNC